MPTPPLVPTPIDALEKIPGRSFIALLSRLQFDDPADKAAFIAYLGVGAGVGGSSVWGSITGSLSDQTDLVSSLATKADLVSGKVPASQLPAYVDAIDTFANLAAFPGTGIDNRLYVAADTSKTYRWSGSAFVEISASLALGETSSTAYRGDRGKTAYDHTALTNNPHAVTKAQVGLGGVDDGLQLLAADLVTSIGAPGTDGHVPSEKAVRNALDAISATLVTPTFDSLLLRDFYGAHTLRFYLPAGLSTDRVFAIDPLNGNRSLTLGGDITIGGALTSDAAVAFSGAYAATFNLAGVTNVTFPASGTLATTIQLATKADLVSGKVPASQLPAYVDAIDTFANLAAFPGTGIDNRLYVAADTSLTYRWSGSAYVEISASLALGSTSSTAHRGDHGATAYTHSQATGNPHGTTLPNAIAAGARGEGITANTSGSGVQAVFGNTNYLFFKANGWASYAEFALRTESDFNSFFNQAGQAIVTSVGTPGTDLNLPSEKAVRDALDALGGGGSPAGADTEIQFNDSGSFGSAAGFTYTPSAYTLALKSGAVPNDYTPSKLDFGHMGTNPWDSGFEIICSAQSLSISRRGGGPGLAISSSGNGIIPTGGASLGLGYQPWSAAYFSGFLDLADSSSPGTPSSGGRIYSASGEMLIKNSDGTQYAVGSGAPLRTFIVATVPTASDFTRGMIYVSDESGGATPAFSDGTNWRRVSDRAAIS